MGIFHRFTKKDKENNKDGKKENVNKKQKKNELKMKQVDHYFGYLLTIYNEFADKYAENEDFKEGLNPHSKEYIKNLEHGIQLTKKAYDKINAIPYVYDIPKTTQQYMKSSKEQFLMNLENYIKRDEVIKKAIAEAAETGNKIEIFDEFTIPFTVKAQFHMETATTYMDQARESI
ncbi:hypothetical protein [Niallia endozanthoxylica]|uniref:Uncharacterized protein n=1 Tax=Niallia endozanthoxylica TaxID=2036016 RepID=A0A5J5HPJ0_9BACI|nr:hypothetical protein [Niallia endozanthoxylica]KAA9023600.1 hypothetical protein F4V44_13135 [Niallia endozanthoxylica]